MSDNQQHIIKKQRVNVHFRGSQTDALALQSSLSDVLKSKRIEGAIAQVLSEFSNENEYLILEKIEIDLGIFLPENIEQTPFLETLQDALRKQISDAIPEAILKGKQIYKSIQVIDYEQFIFFLEQGFFEQLPIKLISEKGINSFQDWLKALIEQLNFSQIQHLKTLIFQNFMVRQRLIFQLSNENFVLIIKKIITANTENNYHIEESLWQIKDVVSKQILLDKILLSSSQNLQNLFNNENNKQANHESKKQAIDTIDSTIKEAIFIQNAGIVLLHPFIFMMYKALGWTEKGIFKDNVTQQKAILMWHYLATGSQDVAEYALVLPKILCGMSPQTPLGEIEFLSETEQQEAEAMLQAVIDNWHILKNTSPDGLRAEFLQRDGKLDPHSLGGLTLTVEKKASDILLNSLTWGISLVKFDCMKEIIYINWS